MPYEDEPIRPPRPSLGWRYEPDEEAAIVRAKAQAADFMKGYGRGRQPYEIDLSHYEMGTKTT